MSIYWMFLFVCPLLAYIAERSPRITRYANGKKIRKPGLIWSFLSIFVIIFFLGLRSGIADTRAYINGFQNMGVNALENIWSSDTKDKGFVIFTYVVKYFIKDDFHVWLFLTAAISGIAVVKTLHEYSVYFSLSVFVFIASAQFTWMFNGIRQFIAISLLFTFFYLLINKKYLWFIALVLPIASIHFSTLIVLPFFFLALGKPFTFRNAALVALFIMMAYFSDLLLSFSDQVFENTQYQESSTYILATPGSNVLRLIVAIIPVALCYLKRQRVARLNSRVLNFLINMSIYNIGFYMISTSVGGIFMGRMAAYFDIFSLLLYPMIIKQLYFDKERRLIKNSLIVGYLAWFYYQMVVTWNSYYISDILGITLFN